MDQVTKHEVRENLSVGKSIDIIGDVFEVTHVVNKGGAWGMLSGFTYPLAAFSAAVSIGIIVFLVLSKSLAPASKWALTLIVAGGIGNLTDRLLFGHVTDMFSFSFFSPVFNFADISITCGCILMIFNIVRDGRSIGQKS